MKKLTKLCSLLVALLIKSSGICNAQSTTIKIYYPQSLPGDSLVLYQTPVSTPFAEGAIFTGNQLHAARDNDGWFGFHISEEHLPMLAQIVLLRHGVFNGGSGIDQNAGHTATILDFYPVKKADQIIIEIKERTSISLNRSSLHNFYLSFKGKGALKYTLRRSIDTIRYYSPFDVRSQEHRYLDSTYSNSNIVRSLRYLEQYKAALDSVDYNELKAHAIYLNKEIETVTARSNYEKGFKDWSGSEILTYIEDFQKAFEPDNYHISNQTLLESKDFCDAELNKQILFAIAKHGKDYRPYVRQGLITGFSGALRDKLLLYYLTFGRFGESEDTNQIFEELKPIITTPLYKSMFEKLAVRMPGRFAYDFKLPDSSGKIIKLHDFKGKVVFMDFWFTGCENCTRFYRSVLSKVEQKFKDDPEVVFISVSIDKSRSNWLKSIASDTYTSPSIVNLYTNGEGVNSDIIKYYQIFAYPQPILIGRDQKLKYTKNLIISTDEFIGAIEELKQAQ